MSADIDLMADPYDTWQAIEAWNGNDDNNDYDPEPDCGD